MKKKWTHFQQKLRFFLYRTTLRELAGKVFDQIKKKNNSFKSIATSDAELVGKLVRRCHLYSLLWLLEKWYFI